jgi:peptidoglycan/xylan/chitin deacetylase (PgdA/CDA1 family)
MVKIGRWPVNRTTVKRSLTRAVSSVPLDGGRRATRRVVVLNYHSIHPTNRISSIRPEQFREQLAWIAATCTCSLFGEIPEARQQSIPSDRPVVAITFDDGYEDNHEYALPLLEEAGLVATFFLTVGLIQKDRRVMDRFRGLLNRGYEEYEPMSWTQIEELRDSGMEIGSHTYSHPNLALSDPEQVEWELSHSKEVLEQQLGQEIGTMAYPFGKPRRHFTAATSRIAATTGYKQAGMILHRGVKSSDSPLAIPRFNITEDTLGEVKARVWGRLDVVGFGQAWAPRWLAKLTTPTDFKFDP